MRVSEWHDGAVAVIDADQHLFEPRTMWADHADPADRDLALGIVDDEAGNAWVRWRDQRIGLAHVTVPGLPDDVGDQQQGGGAGGPPRTPHRRAPPPAFGGAGGAARPPRPAGARRRGVLPELR